MKVIQGLVDKSDFCSSLALCTIYISHSYEARGFICLPIPSFQSDIIISMNMSAGIFFDGFYLPIQLSFIVPMIEKEGRGIFPLSV